MSTVIFGGSFDPVHMGHISIIKEIFNSIKDIDTLYVIPAGSHPEGKQYLFTDEQRLKMLEAVLGLNADYPAEYYNDKIIISDIELQNGISYTIDTIIKLNADHLVLGADQAEKFSEWRRAGEIAERTKLWCFPRKNHKPDPKFDWHILNTELQNISSTYIRDVLGQKDSINDKKIPKAVIELAGRFLS